jgi:hypothetical protein
MKMTGLMFIMCSQFYIADSWSAIPVFVYVSLVPSMGILSLAFMQITTTEPVASLMTHWAIAVGVLVLFIYSAIDTLRQQLKTQVALFTAQLDAAAHPAQLEESQHLDTLSGLLSRTAFDGPPQNRLATLHFHRLFAPLRHQMGDKWQLRTIVAHRRI